MMRPEARSAAAELEGVAPAISSADDAVFLRAMALAGDVVRASEWESFVARWSWEGRFDGARVAALIDSGMFVSCGSGWFVPADVAAAAAERLPLAMHPALLRAVGEMLAREADSLERLRMGMRRLLAAPDVATIDAVCRRWASTPAGIAGPRGDAFVAAVGGRMIPPRLQDVMRSAVPESRPVAGRRVSALLAAVFGGLVLLMVACATPRATVASAPVAVVEPAIPAWYPAPASRPGMARAAAVRDDRELRRAVDAADATARSAVARQLESHLSAVADRLSAEASGTRIDATSLRALARETVRALADSAARGDYLIVPQRRGYRAYVLVEASTVEAERVFARRAAARDMSAP